MQWLAQPSATLVSPVMQPNAPLLQETKFVQQMENPLVQLTAVPLP